MEAKLLMAMMMLSVMIKQIAPMVLMIMTFRMIVFMVATEIMRSVLTDVGEDPASGSHSQPELGSGDSGPDATP